MEYSVNKNSDIPTVSTASVFDTARCLIELNAIDESVILKYLPDLAELLNTGWHDSLVESRWVESDLIRLWQLANTKDYPQVGVDVATHQEMDNFGVLAKWVAQCDDLKEAFILFIENIQLLNLSEHWKISETQSDTELSSLSLGI